MSDEKKVLIVDDEPDAIEIVEAMLSELDSITTLSANDGDSALAVAKDVVPDLIILDVQMPGKSGFDVFSELKNENVTSDIPVIMLTGIGEKTGIGFSAANMEEYLGKAPDNYIEKPVDAVTLQKTVSKLLEI
jgi:CheY-like chemotaxis protein